MLCNTWSTRVEGGSLFAGNPSLIVVTGQHVSDAYFAGILDHNTADLDITHDKMVPLIASKWELEKQFEELSIC